MEASLCRNYERAGRCARPQCRFLHAGPGPLAFAAASPADDGFAPSEPAVAGDRPAPGAAGRRGARRRRRAPAAREPESPFALEYRQARDRVRQLQAQSGRLRATHSVVPNPALAAVADQIDAEVADLAAKAAELNASVESAYRRLAADGAEKKGAGPRVVRGAEAASRPLTGLDAAVAQADAVVAAWRGDEAPPPGRLT